MATLAAASPRANWGLSCATSPHLSPGLFLSPEPERNRLFFHEPVPCEDVVPSPVEPLTTKFDRNGVTDWIERMVKDAP